MGLCGTSSLLPVEAVLSLLGPGMTTGMQDIPSLLRWSCCLFIPEKCPSSRCVDYLLSPLTYIPAAHFLVTCDFCSSQMDFNESQISLKVLLGVWFLLCPPEVLKWCF